MALERQFDIDSLYALYDGRRPEPLAASDVSKVDLGLNKGQLVDFVTRYKDKAVSKYDEVQKGDPLNLVEERRYLNSESQLLLKDILGEGPVSFQIVKNFWKIKVDGNEAGTYPPRTEREEGESVIFELYNAFLEIGGYRLDKENGNWALNERMVKEEYRDQGIGSVLFTGVEAFVQEYADKHKTAQKIVANTGQPRVLLMFLNKGFKAATPEDQRRIDMILSGDENLELDYADLYDEKWVEDKVVGHEWVKQIYKDPYVFQKGLERKTEVAALRVNLVKTFEPKSTRVNEQQELTAARTVGTLNKGN